MTIQTIYVVGALHGNEVFALKVLAQLELLNQPGITVRVGNPEAIAKRRSYIESDLNRSFGAFTGDTQEGRLARLITADITRLQPDLIFDVHSAVAKIGKVGIVAADNANLHEVARLVGMEQVAVMPPHIHEVSLVGQFPQRAISLDFGRGLRSDKLARQTAEAIAGLVGRTLPVLPSVSTALSRSHSRSPSRAAVRSPHALPVYYVQRTIQPSEAQPSELTNYVFHPGLGGYPFLASATGYKEYRGFLAIKKDL